MQESESLLPTEDNQTDTIAENERCEPGRSIGMDMKPGLGFFFYFHIICVPAIILILVVAILVVRFILRDFVLREADIAAAKVAGIGVAVVLAVTVLGVFATLMYVIRRAEQRIDTAAAALQQSEEKMQRSDAIQAIFNRLLSLSLEDLTLEEMLARSIDYITDIPWLTLESKGAIFLVEDEPEMLVMKAQKGLPRPLQAMCDHVPFGECVCGRAAASREVTFTNCLYKLHDRTYEGISEHGHYCVPIISAGKVIGIINTYVKQGHQRMEREEEFLLAASAVVAEIVERKRAEEALAGLNEELESAVRVLSGVTKVLIPRGTVFKRHETE